MSKTPPMQFKKLLEVADIVDATPKKHWYMAVWWCGTAGCAIGNYCDRHPRVKLKVVDKKYGVNRPKLGKLENQKALSVYFGIDEADAEYLFLPGFYSNARNPTRRQVSARIRNFVKKHSIARATSPEEL